VDEKGATACAATTRAARAEPRTSQGSPAADGPSSLIRPGLCRSLPLQTGECKGGRCRQASRRSATNECLGGDALSPLQSPAVLRVIVRQARVPRIRGRVATTRSCPRHARPQARSACERCAVRALTGRDSRVKHHTGCHSDSGSIPLSSDFPPSADLSGGCNGFDGVIEG